MNSSVNQKIEQVVRSSKSWTEAKTRVLSSFGAAYVYDAEGIALKLFGREWIDGEEMADLRATKAESALLQEVGEAMKSTSPSKFLGELESDNAVQRWVLIIALIVVVLAILFPPFYMPMPENLVSNMGFAFILLPPGNEYYRGLVNVPLLLTEFFAVLIVAAIAWRLAKNVRA